MNVMDERRAIMQAIGLCRFSYPALGGFQITHETIQDRIRFLYNPARMEERFLLFEHVALPAIRAQTDPRFSLIIVVGDSLPRQYRDRLHDLVSNIPQIRVEAHAPEQHRQIMKRVLNAARADFSKPCLQFRFDDDDAVSIHFVANLRTEVKDCKSLITKHQAVAFDWHKGMALRCDHGGIGAATINHKLNVASLGVHVRAGSQLTIMNFAHHRIDRFMPVVSFGRDPMWVETFNRFNDSAADKRGQPKFEPLTNQDTAELWDRFCINAGALQAAFSGPDALRETG